MSAVDAASTVSAQVAKRWQAIDPLLPAPAAPAGCGADLTVTGAGGPPSAIGTCEHWAGEPGTLDLAWGAARRFQLTAHVAGPDVAAALDQLLARWRKHLAATPGTDADDTAAVVTWPSRDIDGIRALMRHGFQPQSVVAARVMGRAAGDTRPAAAPVRIRRAGPADVDVVTEFGVDEIRYDAHFGGVTERQDTADAMRREVTAQLAGPEPWIWLAERDGTAIGLVTAERPEAAAWIAPLSGPAPVSYIPVLIVRPGERSQGTGAALVAELHRQLGAAGIAVALLHYEQTNPLAAPFWGQQRYRPLWTSWEARPARLR
jgi:GNAT superfamily N-acetyltransferase